jgi:hypothetical protein
MCGAMMACEAKQKQDARKLGAAQIRALAALASRKPCACTRSSLVAWTKLPLSFPEKRMLTVGTLCRMEEADPILDEFHPEGTNYWSEDAPIALGFFPYNRCEVLQCQDCQRCFLSYSEYGGYYFERRIRAVSAHLVVDSL